MTRINKLPALLLAIISTMFISLSPVVSQELAPDHIALARKYVDLTDQASIYELSLLQSGINTMQTLITQNPEIKDELDEAIGLTINEYASDKGSLLNQFARVYASRFTMDELQQIVDFYETDIGKKLAENNVDINKDLRAVMGVFEANLRIEFFAKVRSRLRAKGLDI